MLYVPFLAMCRTEDAVIGYLNRKAADGTDDATGNN